jgi:hypothetical protein
MARNNFNVAITLPITQKVVNIFEINNKDFLTISKFTQNNDFTGLVKYVKQFIEGFDNIDHTIDKVYTLIALRSLFISDDIQVLNKEKISVDMSLSTILNQLELYEDKNVYEQVIDNFTINYKRISHLPGDSVGIYSCIDSITYMDNVLTLDNEADIEKILNLIPSNVFSKINQHIITMYKSYNNVCIVPGNIRVKLEPLHINLIDEQLQKFIISIYNIDLQNILETLFVFSQHFKNVDYFSLSPLDSRVLENILHRELKEANKSQEQHANPLIPHL